MVGRRSPCKIEFFRSEPPKDVCGLLDVSGMIDGDVSNVSAFINSEDFQRTAPDPRNFDAHSMSDTSCRLGGSVCFKIGSDSQNFTGICRENCVTCARP
jgi:hypothetical protein